VLVGVEEVVDVGSSWLTVFLTSAAQHADVEVDVARRVARDRGVVVDAVASLL
jgi:hypothetical protein